MEKALENTIIAKKYSLTLKSFFKDDFKYWNDCYLIPLPISNIPKDKFLIILKVVVVMILFVQSYNRAMAISFYNLLN